MKQLLFMGIIVFSLAALWPQPSSAVTWSLCRTEGGTTSMLTNQSSITVPLAKPITDTTQAFLLLDSTGDVDTRRAKDHMVSGFIYDATTLQFDRVGLLGTAQVSYTVVECFDNEFRVQRGLITLSSGSASQTDLLTTPVNAAANLVLVSMGTDDTSTNETASLITGTMSDTSNVLVERDSGATSPITSVRYEVIDFGTSAVTVQTNEVTLASESASVTDSLTIAADPSRSWLYCSYDAANNGLQQTSVGCELTNSTTVTFYRAQTSAYTNRIRYYVITWPDETVAAQRGTDSIDPNGTDGTQYDHFIAMSEIASKVKGFSFVTNTTEGTGTVYPRNRWLEIIDGTATLRTSFWRSDTTGTTDYNTKYWQVIQFPAPYEAIGWGWIGNAVDTTTGATPGLISFNCDNLTTYLGTACGDGSSSTRYDYNVQLDHGGCASTCEVTGQAWVGWYDSNDSTPFPIGMIDFDPDVSSGPPVTLGDDTTTVNEDESADARWNEETGELYGWARFRSLRDYEVIDLGGTANDWGWIKLRGTFGVSSTDYGVLFDPDTLEFSGWAWNDNGTNPKDSSEEDGSGFGWTKFDLNLTETVSQAWLGTTQGDVYSRDGITASDLPPAGEYNATYLIQANGSVTNFTSELANTNTSYGSLGIPSDNSYQVFRGALGNIRVNDLITTATDNGTAQTGDCTESLLSASTNPLEGNVFYCSGNLTISNNLTFYNASSNGLGSGTVVVGGNLIIEDNMSYYNNAIAQHINNLASVAWVVLGNVQISPTVTELVGAYIVLGTDFSTGSGTLPLEISGLVMARSFNFQRTAVGSATVPTPAELIRYDGRTFANPPPGLEDVMKVLPRIQ